MLNVEKNDYIHYLSVVHKFYNEAACLYTVSCANLVKHRVDHQQEYHTSSVSLIIVWIAPLEYRRLAASDRASERDGRLSALSGYAGEVDGTVEVCFNDPSKKACPKLLPEVCTSMKGPAVIITAGMRQKLMTPGSTLLIAASLAPTGTDTLICL